MFAVNDSYNMFRDQFVLLVNQNILKVTFVPFTIKLITIFHYYTSYFHFIFNEKHVAKEVVLFIGSHLGPKRFFGNSDAFCFVSTFVPDGDEIFSLFPRGLARYGTLVRLKLDRQVFCPKQTKSCYLPQTGILLGSPKEFLERSR